MSPQLRGPTLGGTQEILRRLAAKNAIMIVEVARQHQEEGSMLVEATVYAAQTRLRPALLTSLAFIQGAAPSDQ